MVDFQSKISGYVKNEAQDFAQKTINDISGKLSGIGGGVINSLIGSVSSGLSQNLLNIGNAFNVIEAVAAQKLDGIVAGGDPEFASGGKCGDRSTVGDLSSARNPGGTYNDHMQNVNPESKISESYLNTTGSSLTVLTEASEKYYLNLRFYKYDRSDLFKKTSNSTMLYQVALPLPIELLDSHRTEFSTPNLKTVGNFMNNGLSASTLGAAGLNAGELAVGTLMSAGATSKNKKLASTTGVLRSLAGPLGIDPENIVNVVEQYLGVAPNPNPSYVFEGPTLREFSFNWIFNPRNADESKRLKVAINKMKASSLPATAFGDDTGLLRYPHVAMLNFYPWDFGSNVTDGGYGWGPDSFIKMKRCVISNISTNYAPTGSPSFFSGTTEPVYISLNITFKEIEFFMAGDLDPSNRDVGLTESWVTDAYDAVKDKISELVGSGGSE